eukprot:scaffold2312_cov165-Ochromonas_danica.AAC.31
MDWKSEFLKILQKIMSRKDSEFFRDAVNWKELGLFDYPTIIKKPMHLRLVKATVERDGYRSATEAAADMRLIFSNAMTYNAPGSKVYVCAKNLGDFWETSWAATQAGAEDDIDRPPSKEALIAFVERCHFIFPEELAKVLMMIEENCPNSIVKKPESNEIEVNTDLINGRAFHEAQTYLASLLPALEEGPQKRKLPLEADAEKERKSHRTSQSSSGTGAGANTTSTKASDASRSRTAKGSSAEEKASRPSTSGPKIKKVRLSEVEADDD